ncbi:unnamed protein product [Bemisia tabaci]|uniref:Uncharacterized protein n=1 Tax=Bemisia tabaci TaxID=7038 RepID=A0A9P0A4R4_BEMTA|nr:unnamed protein product [Bemisia tabaci]
MLLKSQMLFLLLFLLAETHQDEIPKTDNEESKVQATKPGLRKEFEALGTERMANSTPSRPWKKVPITISNRFPGNNGRIHKLYYVIPGPGKDTALHRKRTHEVKVRLRTKRDLDHTRYRLRAATRRRRLARALRQRRKQRSTQQEGQTRGRKHNPELHEQWRSQQQKKELEPCERRIDREVKHKGIDHASRTKRNLAAERRLSECRNKERAKDHRLRVQRLKRELAGSTSDDWSEEEAMIGDTRGWNEIHLVDVPSPRKRSKRESNHSTGHNDYKPRGLARSKIGRGEVLRIDVGSSESNRPRRDAESEPEPIRDLVEVLRKDPGYKGLDEMEMVESVPVESADGRDSTRDPAEGLKSDLADDSSRSKRESGADPDDGMSRWQEWRLKREDADVRWRMRTRTPRDHKFVTKSQLKTEQATNPKSNGDASGGVEEPPVIKVYTMPDEGMAKSLRAGKGRELSYARGPTKRIIYYATLPEIIRRPMAPEWVARNAGAFSQRGMGGAFGSSLLPFAAGGGPGGDIARIQSAIMDVRPSRDNLTPTSPQFTVVDIGRFPSLNDIASTSSVGSASSSPSSNEGGAAPTPAVPTPPEDPLSINSILPPLNNNFLSSIVTPLQMNSVNGATGYQPAPYYPGPFPTRHHRFPPPTHGYQPYITPTSLGGLSNYKLDQGNGLGLGMGNYKLDQGGGLGLGMSNYRNSQLGQNLGPGLSSLLSGGGGGGGDNKYPYYYEYTGSGGGRVDPLKNHLLFSPSWGQPTPLYERLPPATHSSHSVVIDSQSININATSTGNSTRITPPVVTNVTHHYESHE